jgi:hypothetical protein
VPTEVCEITLTLAKVQTGVGPVGVFIPLTHYIYNNELTQFRMLFINVYDDRGHMIFNTSITNTQF